MPNYMLDKHLKCKIGIIEARLLNAITNAQDVTKTVKTEK